MTNTADYSWHTFSYPFRKCCQSVRIGGPVTSLSSVQCLGRTPVLSPASTFWWPTSADQVWHMVLCLICGQSYNYNSSGQGTYVRKSKYKATKFVCTACLGSANNVLNFPEDPHSEAWKFSQFNSRSFRAFVHITQSSSGDLLYVCIWWHVMTSSFLALLGLFDL